MLGEKRFFSVPLRMTARGVVFVGGGSDVVAVEGVRVFSSKEFT